MICPCTIPDLDPDNEDGYCIECSHAFNEHNEDGSCTIDLNMLLVL